MKNIVRSISYNLGIADIAKEWVVKARQIGELVKFSITERPSAASTILLAGSGRGGTTWVSEILTSLPNVQLIYEPLRPESVPDLWPITNWNPNEPRRLRSYYLNAEDHSSQWHDFLEKMLTGQIRNYWTDVRRTSYFPNRFLIKAIRANLMLGYIYENFHPFIICLKRHPCATIASRLNAPKPWYPSVQDLLAQEKLVEDYLRPWIADIEKDTDIVGANAIWWAVENMVADKELESRHHYTLSYEALCLEPQQNVRNLLEWLNLTQHVQLSYDFRKPSRLTNPKTNYESQVERLIQWKKQLDQRDQYRIIEWAHKLGVDYYDDTPLPVAMKSDAALLQN